MTLQLNEILLGAWLRLSTSINNNRVVSEISYNESLICNILYRNMIQNPGQDLTATDLCSETKILKSQMNRILTQLENKNLITRVRSEDDHRKLFVRLNSDASNAYLMQHKKILALLDAIISKIGEARTLETIRSLNEISGVAEEFMRLNQQPPEDSTNLQ
ncbi:MAG: MarR family transcriptional regulator [Lachnospiraceae bacterium]|nr:MarR family transcriptional regulator [Lachnospiraceae bacterium]